MIVLDWFKRKIASHPLQHLLWSQAPILAVDLELTGLQQDAHILSAGWVKAVDGSIDLSSCQHRVIACQASLQQSPVIHGLVAADMDAGEPLHQVLSDLFEAGADCIWAFHNTALDLAAISRGCVQENMNMPSLLTLDTLIVAKYLLDKQQEVIPTGALTLSACRERLQLAMAPAHNAVDDAMATLELALALLHQLDPKRQLRFAELKHTKAIKAVAL